MVQRSSTLTLCLFVCCAGIKSASDALAYAETGFFNTLFHGRQSFHAQPIDVAANAGLDALALLGIAVTLRAAWVGRGRPDPEKVQR